MANDNKISIDVTVNGDGQKQIDRYIQSFDSLRNSIFGLSQPFNSFSNNLNNLDRNLLKYTESVTKLNNQHDDIISSGDKVHNKVTEMATSFSTGVGVLKLFNLHLKALYVSLTAGLSLVIAFLPEIINFAKAFLTGKDAIGAMTLNLRNLNEVTKASNKDAASEVTRLQILYKSATDVNNTYDDRIGLRVLKKFKKRTFYLQYSAMSFSASLYPSSTAFFKSMQPPFLSFISFFKSPLL